MTMDAVVMVDTVVAADAAATGDAVGMAEAHPVRTGFAALLRQHIQTVHREAERTGFIADLLHGRATRAGYAAYLRNLLPVYEAMEHRLAAGCASGAFADPRLARAAALRGDLAALGAAMEASFLLPEACPVLPEAEAYAAAVRECGDGLLGHAYARYLGDLSGGQILKALLARTLGLSPGELRFYDFPDLDVGACKASLRQALDALDAGSREAVLVLAAAASAFRHTIALSQALSASAGAAPLA